MHLLPEVLKNLKSLFSGDEKQQNLEHLLSQCPESISLLTLALLLAAQQGKDHVCQEISQLALTVMLALCFYQPAPTGLDGSDPVTFSTLMTEKPNFDVFQYAFLKMGKQSSKLAASPFVSDFVIILQKLSQQEP